jgi:hypothetical protein
MQVTEQLCSIILEKHGKSNPLFGGLPWFAMMSGNNSSPPIVGNSQPAARYALLRSRSTTENKSM